MLKTAQREANMRALAVPTRSLHAGTMAGGTNVPAKEVKQKLTRKLKVSTAIRESARGEECLMRLPRVCLHDPATTIWSHYRGANGDKGMGTKALDLAGCYACTECDAVYDGQRQVPGLYRDEIESAWHEAHIRSLVRLAEKGLLG